MPQLAANHPQEPPHALPHPRLERTGLTSIPNVAAGLGRRVGYPGEWRVVSDARDSGH